MKNGRLVAFEIIQSIFRDGAYSNLAVEKGLNGASSKDKAFVSRLVYGVVERKITLDYCIDKFLNGKVKPKVRYVLRIGAYQLLFMDKIPDSAAINETVNLADDVGLTYYKNLINAVLHKILDNRDLLLDNEDLEIKYSCPTHLINMWKKMYGQETTIIILESINNRPPIFAIPNRKYVDENELHYELLSSNIEAEVYQDVVKINSGFDLAKSKSFADGLFYIEDYSSYSAINAFDVKENDVVLDVCAAPGGKTFSIAQKLTTGKLYSYDLYEHKVKLIIDGAKSLGLENVITTNLNDATIYNDKIPKADKILCDVVCSGFGIVRRKPEIKYKNLDDVKELPSIQLKILETSAKYLKDNGEIMYSTCTLNKKENEKVVQKFIENNGNFSLVKEKTFIPNQDSGDGFYYAILRKNND